MGQIEGKMNESYDKTFDTDKYLSNLEIKQEHQLQDRVLQETLNILRENMERNQVTNKMQNGIDKELIDLFDLKGKLNHNENIPIDQLQKFLLVSFSNSKLARLMYNMNDDYDIQLDVDYSILEKENLLFHYQVGPRVICQIENIGQYSILLISKILDVLIINDFDQKGIEMSAKKNEQKRMFEQIQDYDKLDKQIITIMNGQQIKSHYLCANLLQVMFELYQDFPVYISSKTFLFQTLLKFMANEFPYIESQKSNMNYIKYSQRFVPNEEELQKHKEQQQIDVDDDDMRETKIVQKKKPDDDHDDQMYSYNKISHEFLLKSETLLKIMNIVISYLIHNVKNRRVLIESDEFISAFKEIAQMEIKYMIDVKIAYHLLQMLIICIDEKMYQQQRAYREIHSKIKLCELESTIQILKKLTANLQIQVEEYREQNIEMPFVDYDEIEDSVGILVKQVTLIQICL